LETLPSLELPQTRAFVLDIGKGLEREMAPGPYLVVEAGGIEPPSENRFIQASPSAVCLFTFPPRAAGKQAARFSIL